MFLLQVFFQWTGNNHQFFEWLLFVSVTQNLLEKLYVMVGVQIHYCDMQIAICGLLGKSRLEMAIFFHLRFQMRSFCSIKKPWFGEYCDSTLFILVQFFFFLLKGVELGNVWIDFSPFPNSPLTKGCPVISLQLPQLGLCLCFN